MNHDQLELQRRERQQATTTQQGQRDAKEARQLRNALKRRRKLDREVRR